MAHTKLTRDELNLMRSLYQWGVSPTMIAKHFGMSPQAIHYHVHYLEKYSIEYIIEAIQTQEAHQAHQAESQAA